MTDLEWLELVRLHAAITQYDEEILWAMDRIRTFFDSHQASVSTILEYGCNGGGNLALLSNLFETQGTVIGVDMAISDAEAIVAFVGGITGASAEILQGSSTDPATTAQIQQTVDGGIDVCFFDSLHTEEQLDAELEQVWPLLSRPAVLAFHDIAIGISRHNPDGDSVPSSSIFWDKIRKDSRFNGYEAKVANKKDRWGIGLLWLED